MTLVLGSQYEDVPVYVCFIGSLTFTTDMEYIEVLTEGLPAVLMVRGGGQQVITICS